MKHLGQTLANFNAPIYIILQIGNVPNVVKLVCQVICGNFRHKKIYHGNLDLSTGKHGWSVTGGCSAR